VLSITVFQEDTQPGRPRSLFEWIHSSSSVPLRELALMIHHVDQYEVRNDPDVGLAELTSIRADNPLHLTLETSTTLTIEVKVSELLIEVEDRGLRPDKARLVSRWLGGVIEGSRNQIDSAD
jgi:hypothetical protein